MKQECKAFVKRHTGPAFIFLFVAFLFSLTTHFSPLAPETYGHDAGIFAGIGHAMKNGRVLYTEIWENKGPLLYFINLFGVSLNYKHGIFVLELISAFVTLIFLYKTALVVSGGKRWLSVCAALAVILMLSATLEGGNLSEEYALPFLSAGQFFVIRFLYRDFQIKNFEIILTGACLMAVLLLRVNIAALFVAIFFVVAVVLIKKKRFSLLFRIIGFALLGCGIFAAPFFIYLIVNGAFGAYLNTAVFGIMGSFAPPSAGEMFRASAGMFMKLRYTGTLYYMLLFFVMFIATAFTKSWSGKAEKCALLIAALAFLINTYANSITAVIHMHYFMTFIPIMLVPLAWMLNKLCGFAQDLPIRRGFAVALMAAAVLFVGFDALTNTVSAATSNSVLSKPVDKICDYVLENTSEGDFVQFIGADMTQNYKTRRLPPSKHIHFASGKFTDEFITEVADEILEGIAENDPVLVIFRDAYNCELFVSRLSDKGRWDAVLQKYEPQETDLDRYILMRK